MILGAIAIYLWHSDITATRFLCIDRLLAHDLLSDSGLELLVIVRVDDAFEPLFDAVLEVDIS
jgi:hypothetical protein